MHERTLNQLRLNGIEARMGLTPSSIHSEYDFNPKTVSVDPEKLQGIIIETSPLISYSSKIQNSYADLFNDFGGSFLSINFREIVYDHADAFFSASDLRVDVGFEGVIGLLRGKISKSFFHELRHLGRHSQRKLGEMSFYDQSIFFNKGGKSFYGSHFRVEEIYTFYKDLRGSLGRIIVKGSRGENVSELVKRNSHIIKTLKSLTRRAKEKADFLDETISDFLGDTYFPVLEDFDNAGVLVDLENSTLMFGKLDGADGFVINVDIGKDDIGILTELDSLIEATSSSINEVKLKKLFEDIQKRQRLLIEDIQKKEEFVEKLESDFYEVTEIIERGEEIQQSEIGKLIESLDYL